MTTPRPIFRATDGSIWTWRDGALVHDQAEQAVLKAQTSLDEAKLAQAFWNMVDASHEVRADQSASTSDNSRDSRAASDLAAGNDSATRDTMVLAEGFVGAIGSISEARSGSDGAEKSSNTTPSEAAIDETSDAKTGGGGAPTKGGLLCGIYIISEEGVITRIHDGLPKVVKLSDGTLLA